MLVVWGDVDTCIDSAKAAKVAEDLGGAELYIQPGCGAVVLSHPLTGPPTHIPHTPHTPHTHTPPTQPLTHSLIHSFQAALIHPPTHPPQSLYHSLSRPSSHPAPLRPLR